MKRILKKKKKTSDACGAKDSLSEGTSSMVCFYDSRPGHFDERKTNYSRE